MMAIVLSIVEQRPVVEAMHLSPSGSSSLNRASGKLITLQHPGKLTNLDPEGNGIWQDSRQCHEPQTPFLIFRQHIRADHTNPIDRMFFRLDLIPAKWEEATIDFLDQLIEVQEAETGPDRLTVNFCDTS